MATDGERYLAHLQQKQQQETTATLIQAQLENKDLSAKTRKELLKQQKANDYGAHTQIELFKQQTWEMMVNYQEPLTTVKEVVNQYNKDIVTMTAEMYGQQEAKANVTGQDVSGDFSNVSLYHHSVLNKKDPYVVIGNTYFKIDLCTGDIDDHPLVTPETYDLSDFEKHIVYGVHSKSIHVLATLKKFVTHAEELGMTRLMLADVLRELVRNYLPEHASIISFINTPQEVFKAILNTVNYDTMKEQIHNAIKRIKRDVGQSIEIPLGIYRALIMEASQLENPLCEENEIVRKADQACIRTAKYLVEPGLAWEIENFKNLWRINRPQTEKFTYYDLITYVNKLEQKEEHRLKSAKSLYDKTVSFTVFQIDHFAPMGDFVKSFEELTLDVHAQDHESAPQRGAVVPQPTSPSFGGFNTKSQVHRSRKDQFLSQAQNRPNLRTATQAPSLYRQAPYSSYAAPPPPYNPSYQSNSPARGGNTPTGNNQVAQQDGAYGPVRSPDGGGQAYGRVNANQQVPSSRPPSPGAQQPKGRSPTPTPQRRTGSPSPYFRSESGSRYFKAERGKNYPHDTKWHLRTQSGNRYYSKERRDSKTGRMRRASGPRKEKPRKGRNCPACGSRSHSRPHTLDEVSRVPKEKRCPYTNTQIQRNPCTACNKGLYHSKDACVSDGRRPSSRVNSISADRGFNENLN